MWRHSVEVVHEIDSGFLILIRERVFVIPLVHRDSICMPKPVVQITNFVHGSMRALDGKKIKYCGGNKDRPRIHQQQKSGMVKSVWDGAVQVLLRVTIRILEDAVVDAHRKGGNEARRRRNFDALVKGSNVGRLKPTATGAGDVDALRVNIRSGQQIIKRAYSVPEFPASEVGTGK